MKKHNNITKKGKCSTCSVSNRILYYNQVISSSTFENYQTNKSYKIFHEVSYCSAYVMYLMECALGKKQYVRKSETSFNIRLNNHRKDVKKPDTILSCRPLQERNHVFNKHAKLIIIENLKNTTRSKEVVRQRLIEIEIFLFKSWKRYTQRD